MNRLITAADWTGAAWFLGVEEAIIKAVSEVESPRGGYFNDGQVSILYERHWFHRLTKGKFDGQRAPNMSSKHSLLSDPKGGGYGPYSAQHPKLQAAAALNREAALKSASWGKFQILGVNWNRAGYETLQSFINGMINGGESEHLRAFCCYVRSSDELHQAFRDKDFRTIARLFNGPGFAANKWDVKIAAAYWNLTIGDRIA